MVSVTEGGRGCPMKRVVFHAGLWCAAALFGCGDDGEAIDAAAPDSGALPPVTDDNPAQPLPDAGADAQPAPDDGQDDPMTATLAKGTVRGDRDGEAVRFLKIPFAKPPVGELRWKKPVEPEPWEGVRHETEFASPCPQAMSQQSPQSTNEDCLYLNVWRPAAATQDAPVMVWIHGGGNTTGSAADNVPTTAGLPDGPELWYNGRVFAERHGIVVVTLNYRLGVFGFFAHPDLPAEGMPQGNQGLFDQLMALEWVRDNIAAFGGDPDNVTIFGESAGSADVCLHVVSPLSRGLFHRAVSQSGGCTTRASEDQASVDTVVTEFAAEKGCSGDGALDCLRDKPAEELVDLTEQDRSSGMTGTRVFGITLDGEFLPEPPGAYFDSGDIAQVPYILGSNTEEGFLYVAQASDIPTNDEEYLAYLEQRYGSDFAPRFAELYPVSQFGGDYRAAVGRVRGDSSLVCGTHDTARRAAAAGLSVYMYNFNIPWAIVGGLLGPTHASEISHVFGTPHLPMDDPQSEAVAEAMNAYWASFAKTGDPNHESAPATWPRFMPDANDDDLRIQFDPRFEILQSFRKEECALWREYYAAQ